MNKLFDPFTWKINDLGFSGERSTIYTSSYGNGLATLHEPTIKAILLYAGLTADFTKNAAIGTNDVNTVAEIATDDTTDLVMYSSNTHRFLACSYRNGVILPYRIGKNRHEGTELLFAMIPTFLEDSEFSEHYRTISDNCSGASSLDDIIEKVKNDETVKAAMFILCDNVYRRINNENLAVVPNTGNIVPLTEIAVSQGIYAPTEIIAGAFRVFTDCIKETETVDNNSFMNDYQLNTEREFSEFEKLLIPEIPSWYIVPKYLESACKMVSAKLARPVRNILLRGEAGTGKTEAAKAMAAALHLPYTSITCHPDMQITDFIGNILPKLDSPVTTDKIPTFEDIEMDAAYAYSILTGAEAPEDVTGNDVLNLLIQKVTENSNKNSSGISYEYCDSALIRAIKNGWLCEIQEPAVIERPGVLVGLNSLLDTCQTVTLPTGEIIKRHPDCVLVVTTNTTYQGCKEINNSVLSRIQYKKDTELPSESELAERITKITGYDDESTLLEMITVVNEIHRFCTERMITDGSCGVRELIDWVQTTTVLGSVVEAADYTVIPSASADTENRTEIKISCLNPHFAG